MNITRNAMLAAVGLVIACAGATGASADAGWDAHHPRREEVNDRLARQNHRIGEERREGELTRGEAHALHRRDHAIRREERRMASRDGGHLTRADQRALNHRENHVSREIGR